MTALSLRVAACRYAAALIAQSATRGDDGTCGEAYLDAERNVISAWEDLKRAAIDHADRAAKKQRGATKAQLAHRAKLFAPASPSIHDDVAALAVVR